VTLALFLSVPCAFANEPLKGGVEETGVAPSEAPPQEIEDMPAPVLPSLKPDNAELDKQNALKGNVNDQALSGNVEDEGDQELRNDTARPDQGRRTLQGKAELGSEQGLQSDDPDMDDQELQVEWDKWRNNFLYAVQSGVQEALNNPEEVDLRWDQVHNRMVATLPMGTTSWFFCKIDNNRRVVLARTTHNSGFPNFDRAVVEAVKNLDGSTLLRFPKRSRRPFVTQSAGIKTSDTGGKQFFKFGDVERYRTGGN